MVVVRQVHKSTKMVESQSLKFGMDRILSEEISPDSKRSEVPCNLAPPCAACLSSLYRCCRATVLDIPNLYRNEIHAPQPLRRYTNALFSAECSEPQTNATGNGAKRKRSWSRAVFSNLQRKGLEKRFQLQKYITKPDRRQLAATLGLTDAQVKVWFQNRRMKWRHAKESTRQNAMNKEAAENLLNNADSTQNTEDIESSSDIDVQTVENE
ncbi:hypothetical protein RUM44_013683 [Polyplax serrata]|uniref:Homeobox domain-containing protein n=1 Tax=Polyplax serrata TaxID=468196 RepID=A0ABR1BF66_POLSC